MEYIKANGWEKFKEKTEYNHVLVEASNLSSEDPDTVYSKIENELTKVKFSAFGKVKVYSKSKEERKIDNLQRKKNQLIKSNGATDDKVESLNTEMTLALHELQSKTFNKEINQLLNLQKNKGRTAATFHLKNKILGSKKNSDDILQWHTSKVTYPASTVI